MCKNKRRVINVSLTSSNLKKYRIQAGYSVREIQKVLSFSSPEAIYAYEKGKYLPTIDNLIVLADVYNVKLDELIVWDLIDYDYDASQRIV